MGANAAAEPPSRGNIEARFWGRVKELATEAGLGIGSDCEHHLRGFIADGVAQLQRKGFLSDETRIAEAEKNLARFVRRMIEEAKALDLTELRERTFHAAVKALCPIWPFC